MTEKASPDLAGRDGNANGSATPRKPTDAGMRHIDHYAARLPPWRYALRQKIIPFVRAETPYLARLQKSLRSPLLDSYFAFTANLGTHTFFMLMLPILFWCGYNEAGRAIIHLLALGVVFSGALKDLICLPRPVSPPLQRITMSGGASLEYGFPSTHTTNAMSVATYVLYRLYGTEGLEPTTMTIFQALIFLYLGSIAFGRLYCGMHGFLDVIAGAILGTAIAIYQIGMGPILERALHEPSALPFLLVTLLILFVVRVHPEPADDCPCFDDSVAFSGVIIGIDWGYWHYARSKFSSREGMTPFSYHQLGLTKTCLRVFLGLLLIVSWRSIMKPLLLRILPPIFRVFEHLSLDLPRRYFLKASEYQKVPQLRKDDNVIPSASDIPSMLNNIREKRGRAVSIGPQSAADAYETLAYRKEQRRMSRSTSAEGRPKIEIPQFRVEDLDEAIMSQPPHRPSSITYRGGNVRTPLNLPLAHTSAGTATPSGWAVTPLPALNEGELDHFPDFDPPPHFEFTAEQAEKERKDIFGRLAQTRVRYDVEVITKLIVYAGIGWIACELGPILFELIGLGIKDVAP